jgi:hypothetical protein
MLFQDHKSLFEAQHASFHVGMFGKQQSHLTYLCNQQYPEPLKDKAIFVLTFNYKNKKSQTWNS